MLKKRLDFLLNSFLVDGPSGCSCSVYHRGELVYDNCFGKIDLESNSPLDGSSLFRIYSMTKVITCAAALKLFEEGRFLMHDPLSDYLPEFSRMTVLKAGANGLTERRPSPSPIRIKDLFAMTSGLCYGDDDAGAGREMARLVRRLSGKARRGEKISLRDYSREVARMPLAFEPGTRWRYGISHDVLGALIEELSGVSFEDYLAREFFLPLGMEDTSFRLAREKKSRLAAYYIHRPGGDYRLCEEDDYWFTSDCWPAMGGAGLLSTLGDYQTFASMMAESGTWKGRRYLGRSTIDMMRTNLLKPAMFDDYNWDYLKGYGYGFGVRTAMDRGAGGINSTPGEFGWSGMLGTFVLIDPEERLSVVYMQQMMPNREAFHQPRIRAVVYGALV